MVSFSGPLGAQIDWSSGLYNLKQNPSFLLGLSITLHEFSRIVPTQWLLYKTKFHNTKSRHANPTYFSFRTFVKQQQSWFQYTPQFCPWFQSPSDFQPVSQDHNRWIFERVQQFICDAFFFFAVIFSLRFVWLFPGQFWTCVRGLEIFTESLSY